MVNDSNTLWERALMKLCKIKENKKKRPERPREQVGCKHSNFNKIHQNMKRGSVVQLNN